MSTQAKRPRSQRPGKRRRFVHPRSAQNIHIQTAATRDVDLQRGLMLLKLLSEQQSENGRDSIAKSAQNGAWVRLVTGGLKEGESLNTHAIRALVTGREGALIKSRLRVLTPTKGMPSLLHAKIILCDKRQGYLGSANFSQSALDKNFEVGVALGSSQVRALERLLNFFESQNLLEDCTDAVFNMST
jgi:phosphatidylserine/phosphatidylglycerophosphate/cardiolipin synthase-like enzyme